MLADSPAVDRLIEAFRRLPGIGKRTAERLALYLLSAPADLAADLGRTIEDARRRVRRCSLCRDLTESDPCRVCTDDRRDHHTVCVVESPAGAIAIERGGMYQGVYFVLHGAISPLEGVGPDELGVDQLLKRVADEGIQEVIVATNATVEGESTALYLSREITPLGARVSRIAHGVPMGGGLEYADDVTLGHALQGRTTF